jgi:hypothetical protein
VIARARQRRQHLAPAIGELGKSVQQQHARPPFGLEAGLEHVNVETVDGAEDARTYARGQDSVGKCFHDREPTLPLS